MGWENLLLDDVRRNRNAYRALFGASVVIAVFAGMYVFGGALAGLAVAGRTMIGVGLPFVVFPVAYAVLVRRLLVAAATPTGPQPT